MHEFSLMADLLKKIETIANENDADKVTQVAVKIGAMAHISADHFREHFVEGTKGSMAEGAALTVEMDDDPEADTAQDILLVSIDVA